MNHLTCNDPNMKQLLGNDKNHWFSGLNKIFIKELLACDNNTVIENYSELFIVTSW